MESGQSHRGLLNGKLSSSKVNTRGQSVRRDVVFHLTEPLSWKLSIPCLFVYTILKPALFLLFCQDWRMMAAGKFASYHRNVQTNHQFPLTSSMDLLSSKSPLAERRADSFQDVCIHGTLPRKKKDRISIRSTDMFSHMGTLPHSKSPRLPTPIMPDILEEYPFQGWKTGMFRTR